MNILMRSHFWCLVSLCCLVGALHPSRVEAEAQHEFLLFPSVDSFNVFDDSAAVAETSNLRASAGVLYSYSGDRFRFLGEYLWSTDEAELERLKAGWAFGDNLMLWFGRFHSPARYWMSEYHHGQFMQTSITRPGLEEWEDDSGSSVSHITGLLFEFERILQNNSAMEYFVSAGLAPKFGNGELIPYDMLDPHSGHGLSLNGRVGYRPEFFDTASVGFLWSWNEINVVPDAVPLLAGLDRIDQLTAGFFANWQWHNFRVITSFVYFDNKLHYAGRSERDNFVLGYVQPEYEISDDLTLFGRIDTGIDEDHSAYLRMLPEFISHRSMLGIRWDFADFQALTMELADTAMQGDANNHLNFKELRFQWSAAFP